MPLLIEHFANAAEKAAEDSTSAWVSEAMLETEIMLLDLASAWPFPIHYSLLGSVSEDGRYSQYDFLYLYIYKSLSLALSLHRYARIYISMNTNIDIFILISFLIIIVIL